MKKVISILLSCSVLCACTTPTLRRQSSVNLGNKITEKGNEYTLAASGHDRNVYYQFDRDDIGDISAMDIHIPVVYKEKIDPLPAKLPTKVKERLEEMEDVWGYIVKNQNDIKPLTEEKEMVLSANWSNMWYSASKMGFSSVRGFLGMVVMSPLLVLTGVLGGGTEFEDDASWELKAPTSDLDAFNEENLGLSAKLLFYPRKMHLSCEKQDCIVLDEKNKPINKIFIYKELKVDQNRINQLLKEEEAERIRQEAERIRKEKEQRIFEAKQKKECPGLYQMMLYIQRYGTRVPEVAIKTARRFEELDCGTYINQQLYQ